MVKALGTGDQESAVEALKLTTFASNLPIEHVGYIRVDFLVARPASFCVLSGVKASYHPRWGT